MRRGRPGMEAESINRGCHTQELLSRTRERQKRGGTLQSIKRRIRSKDRNRPRVYTRSAQDNRQCVATRFESVQLFTPDYLTLFLYTWPVTLPFDLINNCSLSLSLLLCAADFYAKRKITPKQRHNDARYNIVSIPNRVMRNNMRLDVCVMNINICTMYFYSGLLL